MDDVPSDELVFHETYLSTSKVEIHFIGNSVGTKSRTRKFNVTLCYIFLLFSVSFLFQKNKIKGA